MACSAVLAIFWPLLAGTRSIHYRSSLLLIAGQVDPPGTYRMKHPAAIHKGCIPVLRESVRRCAPVVLDSYSAIPSMMSVPLLLQRLLLLWNDTCTAIHQLAWKRSLLGNIPQAQQRLQHGSWITCDLSWAPITVRHAKSTQVCSVLFFFGGEFLEQPINNGPSPRAMFK